MGEPVQETSRCEYISASVVVDSAIQDPNNLSASHVSCTVLVPVEINGVVTTKPLDYCRELQHRTESSTMLAPEEITEVPSPASYSNSTVFVPVEYSGGLELQAMATLVEHSTLEVTAELHDCNRPPQEQAGLNTQTELVTGQSSVMMNTNLHQQVTECVQETTRAYTLAELVLGK